MQIYRTKPHPAIHIQWYTHAYTCIHLYTNIWNVCKHFSYIHVHNHIPKSTYTFAFYLVISRLYHVSLADLYNPFPKVRQDCFVRTILLSYDILSDTNGHATTKHHQLRIIIYNSLSVLFISLIENILLRIALKKGIFISHIDAGMFQVGWYKSFRLNGNISLDARPLKVKLPDLITLFNLAYIG